jgi:hypothetical protein
LAEVYEPLSVQSQTILYILEVQEKPPTWPGHFWLRAVGPTMSSSYWSDDSQAEDFLFDPHPSGAVVTAKASPLARSSGGFLGFLNLEADESVAWERFAAGL